MSTLASDQSSLEGADLSFRPYFDSALKGQVIVYPALGTKTGVRGLYFSKGVRLGKSADRCGHGYKNEPWFGR